MAFLKELLGVRFQLLSLQSPPPYTHTHIYTHTHTHINNIKDPNTLWLTFSKNQKASLSAWLSQYDLCSWMWALLKECPDSLVMTGLLAGMSERNHEIYSVLDSREDLEELYIYIYIYIYIHITNIDSRLHGATACPKTKLISVNAFSSPLQK